MNIANTKRFFSIFLIFLFGFLNNAVYASVASSCKEALLNDYQKIFKKSKIEYLTNCYVNELIFQGKHLECTCISKIETNKFLTCIKKKSKKDIFYAMGFHCGASYRKKWIQN